MPPTKTHPAKPATFTKSKEKVLLNLDELNSQIAKVAPRTDDKLIFEIKYFFIAISSLSLQFLHIYRLVNFFN